ncbi:MAG: tetratricopeptide repeat protein [Gammaproteobacteria bacterium]
MKHARITALAAALLIALGAQAQEAVRPDVGKPLQAAQDLIKAGKYKEALNKVREADAVATKNANESFLIERMRIAAASGAGDMDTAARSFEALAASGKVSATDKARMAESIAGGYYRAKDYGKAMQWGQRYFKEGGTSASIRTLLIQSQYLSGDFAGAARELTAEIQAAEKGGAAPAQDRLNLLLNAAAQLKDPSATVFALERLVTYYPKKEYWVDLLSRMQRKPGFSDRLVLDTYRLSLATGSLSSAADYMEMGQLALQAGHEEEARQVVDKGFATGVLGTGAEAERHKRLRDLVARKVAEAKAGQAAAEAEAKAAKDGNGLVKLGFARAMGGDTAGGLPMIQQGIAKGGLKRPEDAKLHLGIAQVLAGDGKAQATLRSVAGNDGTADLARLWSLYARRRS